MRQPKLNFVLGMVVGGTLMGGGMLLGGMSTGTGGDASFNKITAQEITLTDYKGRQEFITLKSTEIGGVISVLDRDGNDVMTFGVTRLVAPTGNDQPDATSDEVKWTGVFDIRTSDNVLLVRNAGNTFGGYIGVNNSQGRNAATMGVQKSLNGVIAANDLGGKTVAIMAGTTQGGIFQSQDRRSNILGRMP